MRRARPNRAVLALLVVVLLGVTGCKTAKVGARCVRGAAQDATHILLCKRGRWVRWITRAQGERLLAQFRARQAAPVEPDQARLNDMVSSSFASSALALEMATTEWKVVDRFDDGGTEYGLTWCGYRMVNGRPVSPTARVEVLRSVAASPDPAMLRSVVVHEAGHVAACHRWPTTSAPPGWPTALNGDNAAESYADCFAIGVWSGYVDDFYGCPGLDLPARARQLAGV